ncbi:UDP-N-acetylmuramoyl-L-alanyl-D-glutamate--2,6-diaminopimelate ligase [Mangrovimicrobium sediminis]|uniref:UDP-N-acetylmuramoyl-L-alanyl-D-glutamate--2,6-diaminopimelate ligase n=2 Tax=Mangrovimicrobium sediminis TaxID=2562682 RepID=A0A4Z0M4D9_9GAMM|nr:UDP-N-acetylmuramoyl-L-alanyl-D-glutamate--2,6-diaminopimelate ligase [Haliea sp. SAOS-164]
MPLGELLEMPACAGAATPVCGLQLDSRKVQAGDLFLAFPGDVHDGRQFIEQAVANGAAAVAAEPPVAGFVEALSVPLVEVPDLRLEAGHLAARLFHQPSAGLHMVGVTGTNGKTTTSRLVAQLLRLTGRSCGVIGTLGATLGDDIVQGGNTTPDAVSLQAQLAQWRDADVYAVCMEVSSHALVQGRVNGVDFETAVFTNLSHDHLDYHGDMEAYGRAKLGLFALEGLRHAVINLDDSFSARVREVLEPGVEVIGYSVTNPAAEVFIENPRFTASGVQAMLHTPWGSGEFSSHLPGDFNLLNLAAAISAVVLAGVALDDALAAVPQLAGAPGRMQLLPNALGLQVVVDYAHTPDALEQVLCALRPHVDGDLVVVFGCGGDRDRAKRQVMGRVACQWADRVVVTSDNPRGEDPQAILADIATGCSGDFTLEVDRAAAIRAAIDSAHAGDCIVIAGKGHENYQIVAGEYLPFSDEATALAALAGRALQ